MTFEERLILKLVDNAEAVPRFPCQEAVDECLKKMGVAVPDDVFEYSQLVMAAVVVQQAKQIVRLAVQVGLIGGDAE